MAKIPNGMWRYSSAILIDEYGKLGGRKLRWIVNATNGAIPVYTNPNEAELPVMFIDKPFRVGFMEIDAPIVYMENAAIRTEYMHGEKFYIFGFYGSTAYRGEDRVVDDGEVFINGEIATKKCEAPAGFEHYLSINFVKNEEGQWVYPNGEEPNQLESIRTYYIDTKARIAAPDTTENPLIHKYKLM
jgi:hypothetical protein